MQRSITADYAKQFLSYLDNYEHISNNSSFASKNDASESCDFGTEASQDKFYTILRVNLTDGTYECLFSYNSKIDKDLNQSGNYYEFITGYLKNFVYSEDRKKVAELLNFDNLKESLAKGLMETTYLYRRKEELTSDFYVWVEIKKYISFKDNLAIFTFHDFDINPELMAQMQQALKDKEFALVKHYWEMVSLLKSVLNHNEIVDTNHQDDISYYTEQVYRKLQECYPELGITDKEIYEVSQLAPIHDIGKVKVPIVVLNKKGRLNEAEMETIKTHPIAGAEMTLRFPRCEATKCLNRYSYNICKAHHERYDGRGYPEGLKGDEIPLCAQVVGIVDAYDALISERPYKSKIEPKRAIEMIERGECGTFSPKVLNCFLLASKQDEWLAKAK